MTILSILTTGHYSWHAIVVWTAGFSVALYLYAIILYPLFVDPFRKLPGPRRSLSPFGYGFEPIRRPPSPQFLKWLEDIPNDGLIRVSEFFGASYLIPASAPVLSELLVRRSYDFWKEDRLRKALSIVLGDGLIASEGDLHRAHRKNLMQLFGHRQIKNLHPLVWQKAIIMVDGIAASASQNTNNKSKAQGVVEVYDWASRATLDIIGRVALGYEFDTLVNDKNELARLYEWFFQPSVRLQVFFAAMVLLPQAIWNLLPWPLKTEMDRNSEQLHSRCAQLVSEKKDTTTRQSDAVDILDHMIAADCFSDKELVDELLTFLAAGHETTSTALAWALYALAKDEPTRLRCQSDVVKAVDDFRAHDRLDSIEFAAVLDSIPSLHGVCNESQRLWPSVPSTTRIAVRETSLADTVVPKGTKILIPIWTINRLSTLWGSDATEFVPSRWIDSKTGKPNNHGGCKSNHAFLTYLQGPRSCIGQGFARSELKALLAAWLYCFDFELADPEFEAVPVGVVTVKPQHGLHLRVRKVRSI